MSRSFYLNRSSRTLVWVLAAMLLAALSLRPSVVSLAAAQDGDIWWTPFVLHDSRDPMYRNPGGAAPTNTTVTLRLRTAANDLTAAKIRLYNTKFNVESVVPMVKVATDATHDWYAYSLTTGNVPNIFYYRFILEDGAKVDYYEDSDSYGGTGAMYEESEDKSWALTVYDPAFSTPDWVKNAVFYQVFVDRFRDGDSANNNLPGESFYGENNTIVRSNSAAWNTPVCDPRADTNDTCEGSYSRNFYGGDLQGIIDKLDYLDELGVTALYLNPIFESPSNHKYDTSDFSVIDDNFGDLQTFHDLVAAADALGIKIVLDGVFNHASSMSPYFDRYEEHSLVGACESVTSYYVEMFKFFSDTESPTCSDNRDYPYWFGIFDSLAVLDNEGDFARDAVWGDGVIHPANQPSGAPVAVGTYWIEQGAAGWRLDVAPEVDHGSIQHTSMPYYSNYWENFRQEVHAADPEAYIVGEEWGMAQSWTSGGVDLFTATDGNPGEWDATMNYQQSAALLSFWRDSALNNENDYNGGSSAGLLQPLSPSVFAERYLNLKERYSPEAFAAMLNLLGSHDTQRALWLLNHGHPASPAGGSIYPQAANYDWSDAMQRLRGATLMQFTLEGAPQIYYGDEIGLVAPSTWDGGTWQDDPYNRIPYPWDDETGTPYYDFLSDSGVLDANYAYFKTLATTRNAHAALRTGDIKFLLTDDGTKRLAYLRQMSDGSDSAVVLVNRDASSHNFDVSLAGTVAVGTVYDNALTPTVETYTVDATGLLTVTGVEANSGVLLVQTSAAGLPPAAPNDLTAVVDNLEIDLAWTGTGADTYQVFRSVVTGGGYTLLGSTGAVTYTDTTAVPGVRYYYVIVAQNAATLLESGFSNEANAKVTYNMTGAYRNVQWPPSLTHVISTETTTDNVYAQIYIGGVTDVFTAPVTGLVAQVGYGPTGSDPTIDASAWTWFPMVPNPSYDFGQNNDEFTGALLPSAVGSFLYTVRYSGDNGETWYVASAFNGGTQATCPDAEDNPANNFAQCQLTVNPSSDSTAPSAPVLVKDHDVTSEVKVSWSGATDDVAIGRYRIYRDSVLIAEVDDAVTTYTDNTVTSSTSYAYTVTAVDTSFNEGAASNTVNALTENSLVDVTFTVTVPDFTPDTSTVQVIGGAPALTGWGAGVNLTPTSNPNEYAVTLQFAEQSAFVYKYRRDGTWDKAEKAADGYAEISDRPYLVGYAENGPYVITDSVANWRDVLVTVITPADGATEVMVNATVAVTFNKDVAGGSQFAVTDAASTPVAGTFAYNSGTRTLTFTPAAALAFESVYTVTVSGVQSTQGETQFDSVSASFTTAADDVIDLLINGGFEANPSKPNSVVPWTVVNKTGDKRLCDNAKIPARSGVCAFRFKGAANENSTLEQRIDLSGMTFNAADELVFSAYHMNKGQVKLNMVLVLNYTDAPKEKIKLPVSLAADYTLFSTPVAQLASANVKMIKVQFKHKSLNGRSAIDDVSLMLRQGDARQASDMVVPLPPPNLPSGFRGN